MQLSEGELWGCAALLIERYGDEALHNAKEQRVSLIAKGDIVGAEMWKSIADRIRLLQHPDRDDTTH